MIQQKGWSITELMIGVAIIGILLSSSWPNYSSQMKNSRLNQAKQQLLTLHLAQQRYRLFNSVYAKSEEIALPQSEHYEFSLENSDTESFVLVAKAIGDQQDTSCNTLSIDQELTKSPNECW